MASDVSKAIERLDAQRAQTRLVQERLLQSEKMSSVGQLVSGVAHELNNPLTGIMGFAQLLMLRQLDDDARAARSRRSTQEAERASKIVSNLLTFARRPQGAEGAGEPQHPARARPRAAELRPPRAQHRSRAGIRRVAAGDDGGRRTRSSRCS